MDSAKEKKAIERLKAFEPADGYYLAYSGGKDSDCIKVNRKNKCYAWEKRSDEDNA